MLSSAFFFGGWLGPHSMLFDMLTGQLLVVNACCDLYSFWFLCAAGFVFCLLVRHSRKEHVHDMGERAMC